MRRTKRLPLLACCLLALFAGSTLWAAGQQEPAKAEGPVVMRFSWWGGESRHAATIAVIDLYTAAHPNVSIEPEYGGWGGYYDKLVTQLAGNTAADIIQVDQPWLWSFSQQGTFFKDLYHYPELDLSDFDAEYLKKYCVYRGNLMAIPTGINAFVMGKTVELFKRIGVSLDMEWNWDNFISVGKTFHQKDPETYFYYGDSGEIWHILLMYVQQKYNVPYLINDDFTIGFSQAMILDGFKYVKQMADTDTMVPMSEAVSFEGKENPRFVNGKVGAKIGWSSHIKGWQGTELEIDVGRVPVMPGSKETGVICRPAQTFAINNTSSVDREAAKFLSFFFNDREAILAHGMERSVPPTTFGMEVLRDAGKLDLVLFKGVQANLKVAGTSPNGPSYDNELEDIYKDLIEQVAFGKLSPEAATSELMERFKIRLEEMKP